jgi:antitoxin component of RelBE/YafQ-DinJ toxin-antitoxin module
MKSKQLHAKIHALIQARNALADETLKLVSAQVLENLDLAISELEDAFIAQANAENKK